MFSARHRARLDSGIRNLIHPFIRSGYGFTLFLCLCGDMSLTPPFEFSNTQLVASVVRFDRSIDLDRFVVLFR